MVTLKDYSREEINDNDACADEDVEPNVMNMEMLIESMWSFKKEQHF